MNENICDQQLYLVCIQLRLILSIVSMYFLLLYWLELHFVFHFTKIEVVFGLIKIEVVFDFQTIEVIFCEKKI